MVVMASSGAQPSPGADDSAVYDEFWQEVQEIQEGKDPDADTGSEDELDSKTPDEGEEAAVWLEEAGYKKLVEQVLDGRDIEDDVIDAGGSLTKAQRVTIKRRVNTLKKATLHKKKTKQQGKTDVRDIFSQQEAPSSPPPPRSPHHSQGNEGTESGPQYSALYPATTSPHSQRASRNLSILRGGRYNMDGEGLPQTQAGVETLSIQAKPAGKHRLGSSGSDDALLSPHSHISLPLCDADISLQLQNTASAVVAASSVVLRPKSRSSNSSGAPPPSPLFGSSSPTSKKSSWRGTADFLDGLPYISVQPDNLGVTRIHDLSSADASKLRPLLLLELTTLFDHHQITYTRRKPKKKFKETGVFGVPLHCLIDQDQKYFKRQNQNSTIPLFLHQLITFLSQEGVKEEGILRVPGSVVRIKALCKEIDETFYSGKFTWSEVRPNDAAGLLKQFLRELTAPILTFEYIEAFAQVEQMSELQDKIEALRLLVLLLPEVNRNTLLLLLRFLKNIVDHQENLMTMNNVAMIMAPNLFLLQAGRGQNKNIKFSEFRMAAGTSNIIRMLLFYQHLLWIVPTTMIQQLRHQNEAEQLRKSRDKSIMKLLRKDKAETYKKPQINNENDFNRSVIRVQVPAMKKFNTAIQLDPTLSAGDIVTRCLHDIAGPRLDKKEKSSPRGAGGLIGRGSLNGRHDSSGDELEVDASDRHLSSLYEIGGNIGERRLDSSTKVLEVLRYNPNADWVIKPNTPICQ